MSDLQLGLLIIGAFVVLAVVAYNKWQENRLRRRTESAFATVHEDVLLREGADVGAGEAAGDFAPDDDVPPMITPIEPIRDERVEHTIDEIAPTPAPAESAEGVVVLPHAALNVAVDCVANIECPAPIAGARIAARAEPLFDVDMARLVHWEAYDEHARAWDAVRPDQDYRLVRVGLQLVTQAGMVPQYQIESFASATVELALTLSADVNVIDTEAAVRQAAQLNAFCEDFDVQVGLSVVAGGGRAISGTKIRGVAESAGFVLDRDGRYRRYDEAGLELYTLYNMEPMPFHNETLRTINTRGVTLSLNVPRAPGTPATFRGYIQFARQLAEALDGTLVDDNRQPIGERAIEQVGVQLSSLHEAMAAAGIPAGSSAARRLFVG